MKCGVLFTDLPKAFDFWLSYCQVKCLRFYYLSLKLIHSYLSERNNGLEWMLVWIQWFVEFPKGQSLVQIFLIIIIMFHFIFLILKAFFFMITLHFIVMTQYPELYLFLETKVKVNWLIFHLILSNKNKELNSNINDHVWRIFWLREIIGHWN